MARRVHFLEVELHKAQSSIADVECELAECQMAAAKVRQSPTPTSAFTLPLESTTYKHMLSRARLQHDCRMHLFLEHHRS